MRTKMIQNKTFNYVDVVEKALDFFFVGVIGYPYGCNYPMFLVEVIAPNNFNFCD